MAVEDPGGDTPPPQWDPILSFSHNFCRIAPMSEVGAPPPTGNPGSAAAWYLVLMKLLTLIPYYSFIIGNTESEHYK